MDRRVFKDRPAVQTLEEQNEPDDQYSHNYEQVFGAIEPQLAHTRHACDSIQPDHISQEPPRGKDSQQSGLHKNQEARGA